MTFKALPLQYQSLLFLLDTSNSLQKALQIQAQIFLHGLHHQRLPLSKLISFFALSSQNSNFSLSHSLLHLRLLSHPNIFICNTLIRAFSANHSPSASLSLYKTILSDRRPSPNRFTFTFLTLSCSQFPNPNPGLQIHCHVIRRGFDSDPHVTNSLIRFYSSFRRPSAARHLFDEISHPDAVAFNIMIGGYYKSGCPRDGLVLFTQMVDSGVEPDRFTLAALMPICAAVGDLNAGKAVHALALRTDAPDCLEGRLVDMYSKFGLMGTADRVFGSCPSVAMWSCMVSGYVRCGDVEAARRYFDEMPEKDLISWTSMIGGYSKMGRCHEALELYKEMEKQGIEPDEVTLVAVLSACAKLGDLDYGKRLHRYVEDGFLGHTNAILSAALVDMYAKCGCVGTALKIFNRVDKESKTTSLFNSVISGLAQHGLGEGAVAVFREMEGLGLRPDEITFVGVLGACSRSGLLEEGKELFDLMLNKYGLNPEIEHYGCMVDLFGRGGCLDMAYDFIEKMPIKPNFVIWSTLLHACRIHGNFKIGNIARERLLQLDSSSKGRNSCLSELFSSQRKQENSEKVTSSEGRNLQLSELFSDKRKQENSEKVTSSEGRNLQLSELFSDKRKQENSEKVTSSEGRNLQLSELFSDKRK